MALTSVEREPGIFRSTSPAVRLLLLCILAITVMVLDHRNQYLVGVRKTLAVVLHPIQVLVSAPFEISRSMSESMTSRSELTAENERLNRESLVLNARVQTMSALQAENARLRALLDSTEKVGDNVLIAEIVSVDMNPYRNMILVNKGSKDDAYVGQAVIDADGVVGQITRDRYYSAEAMLVTDIDHATPVELVRNRLRTIAVGTGELDRMSLPFLPSNADVREGDLLITSGLGGTFPPGYPVGVIRRIRSITGQAFLEVDAEPAAALNRIREVLLITPEAGEDMEAAANAEVIADRPKASPEATAELPEASAEVIVDLPEAAD
jgi:rod shape-determining protein MreC